MNRSLANVLFSNFGDVSLASGDDIQGQMKPAEASDAEAELAKGSSPLRMIAR